ncbi:Pleckstrin y domain-containing H member 2 [Balamuthia mandrillaris]
MRSTTTNTEPISSPSSSHTVTFSGVSSSSSSASNNSSTTNSSSASASTLRRISSRSVMLWKARKQLCVGDLMTQQTVNLVASGTLKKLGEKRKTWKKRFFILHGADLYYFKKSNSSSKMQGVIELKDCSVKIADGSTSNKRPHPFCLDLHHRPSGRHYMLAAESDKALRWWLQQIQQQQTV